MLLRTLCLVCYLTISVFTVKAQDPGPGSVTVYSEDGENFTLYLNGEQKNIGPSSRVVAENVKEVPVAFRIVFQNGAKEIKKNGIRQGTHCLYAIQKNKKGERVFKMKGCSEDAPVAQSTSSAEQSASSSTVTTTTVTSTPAQLSATFSNGVISINDGRTIHVKKVKANGMSYPRVFMNALPGARVSITYDDNDEKYNAESPFKYEVKDYSNNNSYLTLTVDEGGPQKTWHVKLQNANGYDMKIE
ncbi:hypothetical protein [Chryseosolibacter indicus]|uniref:Uncharacterized protein n=1 Tax=Chryseosolibacter indicus TaxID=2782351 RepID=A0ABS5VQU8_9BACT|nr:hypothetical protein [Chryseosolibacter indicus]MBT1703788.1 hypothetical protein [Chryseosolibacter indicus]